jgi:hypothetical protein
MNPALAAIALAFLAAAIAMLLYETSRARAGRPVFDGRETITLYWLAYLTFAVLGLTSGIAAVVR